MNQNIRLDLTSEQMTALQAELAERRQVIGRCVTFCLYLLGSVGRVCKVESDLMVVKVVPNFGPVTIVGTVNERVDAFVNIETAGLKILSVFFDDSHDYRVRSYDTVRLKEVMDNVILNQDILMPVYLEQAEQATVAFINRMNEVEAKRKNLEALLLEADHLGILEANVLYFC